MTKKIPMISSGEVSNENKEASIYESIIFEKKSD